MSEDVDRDRRDAGDEHRAEGEYRTEGEYRVDDEPYPEDDPRAVYDHDMPGEDRYDAYGEVPGEEKSSWLDEGTILALFVLGVVLLLFPEPATSTVGLGLIAVAVVAWAIDWLR